jgi:hypothetical protein
MLSGDIRNFNPRTGKVESFSPPIMSYAPNVTNADLDTTLEALEKDPSLSFIADARIAAALLSIVNRKDFDASVFDGWFKALIAEYKDLWKGPNLH